MELEDTNTSVGDDGSSSAEDTSESDTELMVTTRSRRATAGNRYNTLITQEEAKENDEDDEVAMLFAEAEGEDDDFNSDEGDEDADMSSSDDDDQGPNAATDDVEGEKEIQKEAKTERAKKRKADLALTTIASLKKKPKIDPTALRRAPAPKPTKRKERVSWLPGTDVAPGRTSLRKQTILHRAETHAKLKENEVQRLKMKARREKRIREREAEAPKELTQADRLAEAEKVERRNAKSLNRWEATEKKRAEEQAAKLAALKERKLEGAVITWHSTSAKYHGLKDTKDAETEAPIEGKKRGRKPKALLEQLAAAKRANIEGAGSVSADPQTNQDKQTTDTSMLLVSIQNSPREPEKPSPSLHTTGNSPNPKDDLIVASGDRSELPTRPPAPKDPSTTFLTGIHEYASMQTETRTKAEATSPNASGNDENKLIPSTSEVVDRPTASTATEKSEQLSIGRKQDSPPPMIESSIATHDVGPSGSATRDASSSDIPGVDDMPAQNANKDVAMSGQDVDMPFKSGPTLDPHSTLSQEVRVPPRTSTEGLPESETPQTLLQSLTVPDEALADSPGQLPSEPPIEVISTRNLVILEKFDNLSDEGRQSFGLFYNNRKSSKPVKHSQELCPITGLPVQYRDPATGIGYANAMAYKKLQELKTHHFAWSSILGCYVGRSTTVARGVPEGFLSR